MKKLTKKTKVTKGTARKTKAAAKPKTKKQKVIKAVPEDIVIEEAESQTANPNSTLEYNVETSFFYTSDKFINAIDNDNILKEIQKKYPDLSEKNTDGAIKKNIIKFLDDEQFVESVLNFYNLSIFDLFKLLYK